jgi:hypothetical protein
VSLVDNNILEAHLLQCGLLDKAKLVGSDDDLKVLRQEALLDDLGTFLLRALEEDDVKIRRPLLEFACPVLKCGLGDDDDVRTSDPAVVFEVGKKGNCLEGLSETLGDTVSPRRRMPIKETNHLVGKDAVQTIVLERDHPIQALELICTHGAVDDYIRVVSSRILVPC